MDFKFIIILGLVSLLVLYIINEMKLLKLHITTTSETINKQMKNKFHVLINDIRELNTDLVNQTKKINKIHSQQITSMSNYFTDSDDVDGKNMLKYLSENKQSENKQSENKNLENFKIDFGEMKSDCKNSESKNYKTNDDDIISNSSNDNLEDIKNIENISITSENISDARHVISPCENYNNNPEPETICNDKNKSEQEPISNGNNGTIQSSSPVKSSQTKSDKSDKSNKSNKSNSIKISPTHINDITNTNNDVISNYTHKSEIKLEIQQVVNKDQKDSEKNSEKNSDKNSDKISLESKGIKSIHGLISFGSKKSKGNKPQINIGNLIQKDDNTMETNEIKSLSKLNDIETYNKKDLDNIAKIYNIPTFYKDGNKRKLYNKEELYSKIKDEINKKSNQ
jgi:hypothetical protein